MTRRIKYPCVFLYTGDWLKDRNLSQCSPATRGIWIDAVCIMHDDYRCGKLSGTPEQLSRNLRCTPKEVIAAAKELLATKTADVTLGNNGVTQIVTLVNRRMLRESKARENGRLRVSKHRGNGAVTEEKQPKKPTYSVSSSVSVSKGEASGACNPHSSETKNKKKLTATELIVREKELKRVEARLNEMWKRRSRLTDEEVQKYTRLKERRKELLTILGMEV